MFCDTIGRLFLNICAVFFASLNVVSGFSSKIHCFNIARLGASSFLLMKASARCFKFLVNRMFSEAKNKFYLIIEEKSTSL